MIIQPQKGTKSAEEIFFKNFSFVPYVPSCG
jgi:hypothetical protein